MMLPSDLGFFASGPEEEPFVVPALRLRVDIVGGFVGTEEEEEEEEE